MDSLQSLTRLTKRCRGRGAVHVFSLWCGVEVPAVLRLPVSPAPRRRWTRAWWDTAPERYTLLTSEAVLDELRRGDPSRTGDRLGLVQDLPLLEVDPVVGQIVAAYVRHRLMPASPGGDALHLALASYHKCDFLITWNCRHLANANKFGHIRVVNTLLGLFVPALVTPLELLGGEDEPAGEASNGGDAGER